MNFEEAALAYVRHVLNKRNLSAGRLAREAGVSSSTLTRALNDPNHKFMLSMKTIEKIATFSGINPAPFLEASNSAELTTGFYHQNDGSRRTDQAWRDKVTLVVGEVAAGKWREPSVIPFAEYGPITLTSALVDPKDCFACVVRGDSANMIANDGEFLFCEKAEKDMDLPARSSGLVLGVVVERRSKADFKIELSARFIRKAFDGFELISACHDDHLGEGKKKYFETVKVESVLGNNEFSVVGRVKWVIRRIQGGVFHLPDLRE